MKAKSIKNNIIVSIIVFVTILLVTIAGGTYYYFYYSTKKLISDNQFSMVQSMAHGYDNNLQSVHSTLIKVANNTAPQTFDKVEEVQNWLNDRPGLQNIFTHSLLILDSSGILVASYPAHEQKYGTSFAYRDYYKKTINSGKPYISLPFVTVVNNHPVIMLTAPIKDKDGKIIGILGGAIDLLKQEGFVRSILNVKVGNTGYLYLFAPDRTMILHPDSTRIMKKDVKPGANIYFDKALQGFEGSGVTVNSRGKKFLASFSRMKSTGWILAANYPYAEATQPINQFRDLFFLAILIILLISMLMAWRMGSKITKALTKFTLQIRKMAQPGSKKTHLDSSRNDELGMLAESFNTLLDEIHRNQQALEYSRERFKNLSEIFPETIYEASVDGTITYANAHGLEQFGYIEEDFKKGIKIFDLVTPEDRKMIGLQTADKLRGIDNGYLEYKALRKDGSTFDAIGMSVAIIDNGTVVGLRGFVLNITDRKQSERDVEMGRQRANQQRISISKLVDDDTIATGNVEIALQCLIQEAAKALNVGRASVWLFTDDNETLHCIARFETESNHQSESATLKSKDYPHYFAAIKAERCISASDAQTDKRTSEFTSVYLGIGAILDNGIQKEGKLVGIVSFEHLGQQRNWHTDEEAFSATIASFAAQILATQEQKLAEQALRQSEAKHSTMIENISDVIGVIGIDGLMKYKSPNIEKWFGWKPEDLIGTEGWATVHPDDLIRIQKVFYSLFEKDNASKTIEFRYICKDGSFKPIELTATNLVNNPNLNGVLLNYHDITERKQMENALLHSKEAAEAASQAKSDFLAAMSHEIRTPLNGVIGFSDILMKTKLSNKQMEYMRNVNISANSLLDLIDDILDFSKIEAGKLELNTETLDLIELAEGVMDIMTFRFSEKDIEPLLNISPSVPRFITADPIRLRQVLINLLGNASKFTEKGEIELLVTTAPIEDNDRETNITFSIRDTGIGIAKTKQQAIFESFTQADNSTTRQYGGSGLGLAISSNLVQKMGSHIQLQSEEGVGSRFSFTITVPYNQNNATESDDISWIKKVLVIDDNANNRKIVATMLESEQIVIDEASNGAMALEMIEKSNDYDVVIVDYHMPFMDGLQVIKNIRQNKNSANQRIIFLHSSSDFDNISAQCKQFDVKFILVKPIRKSRLIQSLIKINPQLHQETKILECEIDKQTNLIDTRIFTVLIVDDSEMNLKLVESLISIHMPNAKIIETKFGQKACEYYLKYQPDIVLMDIQMPIMNGYEATRQIRDTAEDKQKRIPIIALSAGTVAGEKERCIQAGMDDYIPKPLRPNLLLMALDKYLYGKNEAIIAKPETKSERLEHWNRAEILATYQITEEFVDTLLTAAFSELPQFIANLQTAIIDNDTVQIKFNAHSIKGMARGIGFAIMADRAWEIEKNYESDNKNCRQLFSELANEFEYLKREYAQ